MHPCACMFLCLKFNSHCRTSTRRPRKSSVRVGRQFVSLQRGWPCASLCGHFLFALIPPVALAIRSLSAISPLPCSEGEQKHPIFRGYFNFLLSPAFFGSFPTFFLLLADHFNSCLSFFVSCLLPFPLSPNRNRTGLMTAAYRSTSGE